MLMDSGYRIPIQGLKTRHLKGFTWKGQMSYVPQEGTQGRHTVQQILRGAQHRKELTETTSPLKVTTENTWMYLSCPFPNYWGNCKLTTLDRQTGLTSKAWRAAHRPMYVGSQGTETSMVNTAQPADDSRTSPDSNHHCFHHKACSEQTCRTDPDSGASSTLNPCGESPSYTLSGEVWKEK